MSKASEIRSSDGAQKVLILGAGGRLGRFLHFYREYLGNKNIVFQCRSDIDGFSTWSGDWTDSTVDNMLKDLGPGGVVLNLIGLTNSTGDNNDSLKEANCNFASTLLEKSARYGVGHVCLISSASVYGSSADRNNPLEETDQLSPLNGYGWSKLEMENAAYSASKLPGTPSITIFRVGNVVGADQITENYLRSANDGSFILHKFFGKHGPIRSYLGPKDLAVMLGANLEVPKERFRIFNVACPNPVYAEDLVAALRKHTSVSIPFNWKTAPESSLSSVVLSTRRIMNTISGVEISNSVEDMVEQYVDTFPIGHEWQK